jgi:hypothetical protein
MGEPLQAERTPEDAVRHWWPGWWTGYAEGLVTGLITGALAMLWGLVAAGMLR